MHDCILYWRLNQASIEFTKQYISMKALHHHQEQTIFFRNTLSSNLWLNRAQEVTKSKFSFNPGFQVYFQLQRTLM